MVLLKGSFTDASYYVILLYEVKLTACGIDRSFLGRWCFQRWL